MLNFLINKHSKNDIDKFLELRKYKKKYSPICAKIIATRRCEILKFG